MNTSTATTTPPGSFRLADRHADVQAQAQELAARFAERHREVRLHPFEHGELHPELWGEVCARGWPGLLFAGSGEHAGGSGEQVGGSGEQVGGSGEQVGRSGEQAGGSGEQAGGLLAFAVVMEALAARNLNLWMPVLGASIGHAIAQVGPDSVRDRWLERIASGEAILALAATEPECGHNVFRAKTTVRRDGERFVVNGLKSVTSGIDLAQRVLVFGRSDGDGYRDADGAAPRFTTLLVDPSAPGVERVELPMRGREGARQFQLTFTDVEAPLDELVGAEGQGLLTLWPFTHVERLLTAALALGNARYCLARAVGRARQRTIFGKRPIGAEQAIQHPLASLHARIEATALLVYRAAWNFDAAADTMTVAGEANMAKVLAADVLFDAADHAMQTLGAHAWDEREGMIDVFLDARAARSAPISQELALNFIAQHVLALPSHR